MDEAVRVSRRPIRVLIVGTICALVLSGSAGLLVYNSTQRLVVASDRMAGSQEVLTSLQTTYQSIDRIEAGIRFYQITHTESDLDAVQAAAVRLQTNLVHLRSVTSDDPGQFADTTSLFACASGVASSLTSPAAIEAFAKSPVMFDCRRTVSRMQERERNILALLTGYFRRASFISLGMGSASACLAATLSVALFAFLWRDARHQSDISRQVVAANTRLADSVRQLEERVSVSRMLSRARDELQLCLSVQDAYAATARFVEHLMPQTTGALAIIDNSRQTVERVAWWGAHHTMPESFPLDACCGLRSGHLRWRSIGMSEVECAHFIAQPPAEYLCIPMAAHGETLGVLYVGSPRVASAADLAPLLELIELTSMALANLQLRQKLVNQSIHDSLTGLFNRNFMDIALTRELRRAARHKNTLAVFMIDVDRFKDFNDTFGHEAGDTALREIAGIMSASIRSEDIACRYGGEEFVIILPEIGWQTAAERAESIRRSVNEIRLAVDSDLPREVSISIGIAMFPAHGESGDLLLRAADRNLYRAKQGGRNQVFLPPSNLLN